MQCLPQARSNFQVCLLLTLIWAMGSTGCAAGMLEGFQKAGLYQVGSAYMPQLDIYIFRGSNGFELPNGSTNAAEYIARLFSNSSDSIHNYQKQNDMLFYKSEIRYFYVNSTGLDNTHFTDFSDNAISETTLAGVTSLTLTDESGIADKGTVTIDYNRVVMFFTQFIHPNGNVLGYSTVGGASTINDPLYRSQYRIGISSAYAGDINSLRRTVAHELGHYFGLEHSFKVPDVNSPGESCLVEPQGTTRRIMDYSVSTDHFIDCERQIYKNLAAIFVQNKTEYQIFEGDNSQAFQKKGQSSITSMEPQFYTGKWAEQISVPAEFNFSEEAKKNTVLLPISD